MRGAVEALETIDITDRAVALGWGLPDGWRVMADLTRDEIGGVPTDHGDVYGTDFDVPDYSDPNKGLCEHCEQVIVRGREVWYAGNGWLCPGARAEGLLNTECADCDGSGYVDLVDGDDGSCGACWRSGCTVCFGDTCSTCEGDGNLPGHALAESQVMKWWRRDEWMFVYVSVWVEDASSREWGQAGIGAVEYGRFPEVADDGTVSSIDCNPLAAESNTTGDYDCIGYHGLIGEALDQAVVELDKFDAPRIIAPTT